MMLMIKEGQNTNSTVTSIKLYSLSYNTAKVDHVQDNTFMPKDM